MPSFAAGEPVRSFRPSVHFPSLWTDLLPTFSTSRSLVARALVGLAVVAGDTVVPVRMVEAAPTPRLAELSVGAASNGRVDPSFPITHLGARWEGGEDAIVQARWHRPDGTWSPWQTLEISHDLGDEERGIRLTGLVTVPDGTEAEARVLAGDVNNLKLVTIDAKHGPARWVRADAPPAAAAVNLDAKVGHPGVVSRAEWGADESLRKGTPSHADISRLAVHHTVTTNNDPDPRATVRAIYAYHTQSNGWADIGYNFLVDAQGRIYEGRYSRAYASGEPVTGEDSAGRGVIGAHAAGNNTGSVGVSVLGTFTDVAPTAAALDAVGNLLAWKADRHGIDPKGNATWYNADGSPKTLPTIVGHRDVGQTACPGDKLYALLPSIRDDVAAEVSNAYGQTRGYWELSRDGRVFPFGDAESFAPSLTALPAAPPVVSMDTTSTGNGYWLLSGSGRITTHGDAPFAGSTETMRVNAPVVKIEATRSGRGYWVLGADGGVFAFGDAAFHGSTGAMKLNSPVISMAATPSGNGYWLLAGDGGIFAYGDADFYGSTGAIKLNQPVVSMSPAADGTGYWLVASDGGVFAFNVPFHGSVPGLKLRGTVARTVQLRSTSTKRGYYVLNLDGGIFTFGDAKFHGAQAGLSGSSSAADLVLTN